MQVQVAFGKRTLGLEVPDGHSCQVLNSVTAQALPDSAVAIEAALDWTSKPWDLAPLGIIVEEAGGRSTNLRGERSIYSGQLLSTNGKIHDEVLKLLA